MFSDISVVAAVPTPSTPLGPLLDSFLSWMSWIAMMGVVGLLVFARYVSEPVAERIDASTTLAARRRLILAATGCAVLSPAAILADRARSSAESGGWAFGVAIDTLFGGTKSGWMPGAQLTCALACAALMISAIVRPTRRRLVTAGLITGAVALATSKIKADLFTTEKAVSSGSWLLHLFGGAIWVGGLAGLLLLLLPGAIPAASRPAFWGPTLRRFTWAAMASVAAVVLSGLFLYWQHVDGISQLFTTMYGRVLAVKITLVVAMVIIGALNQMCWTPRISAARSDRTQIQPLVRGFAFVVAVELALGLAVLLAAPFLHGSARNQAFQAEAAQTAPAHTKKLPKIESKHASVSTWIYGGAEALTLVGAMACGHIVSGRRARLETTSDRQPQMIGGAVDS